MIVGAERNRLAAIVVDVRAGAEHAGNDKREREGRPGSVIAGLYPAIHLLRKDPSREGDGCAGQDPMQA